MSGNNNKLDLTKILKNCPKGWKFYTSVWGEVEFIGFSSESVDFLFDTIVGTIANIHINTNGTYCGFGECIIFPSKDQRDWSKFTAPWYKKEKKNVKFNPHTLKPFDKVLVKDDDTCNWRADFYSNKGKSKKFPYMCVGATCKYCIPYNNNTKHLVGTTAEAPEYYRYWED